MADDIQRLINARAARTPSHQRQQIKKIIAQMKVNCLDLDYVELLDGSYYLEKRGESYGGVFTGLNPTKPIYTNIRVDRCPRYMMEIIWEIQKEVEPLSTMHLLRLQEGMMCELEVRQ